MTMVYDSPIGAMPQTGAPMGSLLRGSMSDIPIPSITGGAAGQSGAGGGTIKTNVFSSAGGGSSLWFSIAAIIIGVVWIRKRYK